MTYLARTTHVVEHGSPRVDVTIYRDGGLSSLHDLDVPLFKSAQLARSGYTYDFIDPVDLAQGNDPFDGGPHYRALIVDSQRSLTVDAARAIRRYAAEGLPVVIVGDVPSQAVGLKDPAANDARVQAAMQAALASPSVVDVATEDDVPSALAGLGVDPGARFTGAGADIWTVRRHTGHDETWWLYNPTDSPISTTGSFAASGHPYLLDLWNGTSTALAQYVSSGGRTDLPVTIPAHGTVALVIARGSGGQHLVATSAQHASYDDHGKLVLEDAGGGTQSYTLSNGHSGTVNLGPSVAPIMLTNWHLDVDEITPAGHTAHHLDLSALADWRDIPELADAVGSATYSATFTAPGSWAGRGVRLALGAFAGAARISVNGVRVTRQTTPGGDVVITSLVHPGSNSVVVDLDTTVNNRNAQLAASGNGLFSTGPTPLAPTPSGLLGPVTVTPTEMASVRG